MNPRRRGLLPALLAASVNIAPAVAAPAGQPATAPAAAPAAPVASLQAAALSDDPVESLAALRQLAARGEAGRAALRELAPRRLVRDAAVVEAEAAAAPAELPKLRAAEKEAEPLRAASLALIARLTHAPADLKAARSNYDRLSAVQARLAAGYARQARVAGAMARRAECLAPDRPPEAAPTPDRVDKLAEQALGMPAEVAVGFARDAPGPPAEPGRRGLWFYLTCRRIAAWNRSVEPAMNAAEAAHARRVNDYRELLGLLPCELDPRLIQSARRHSREMIELWYFSHFSPTESERNPWRRMARAGYADGSNENLTMGSWSGDEAFWRLFNSPDHHRAWADPADTALGAGKWENAWTEDIGSGPRLMTADALPRAGAVVQGDELKPQTAEATRRHPRDLKDVKFYDPQGREVGKASAALDPKERGRDGKGGGPSKPAGPGGVEVEVKGPDGKATIRWGASRGATGPS